MRDLSITIDQAAKWLNCSTEQVEGYLSAGRLLPFTGAAGGSPLVSLNSVVVLAEALPAEAGIFRIRESSGMGGPDMGFSPRPHSGPPGGRPPVVVERKPTRGFTPRS